MLIAAPPVFVVTMVYVNELPDGTELELGVLVIASGLLDAEDKPPDAGPNRAIPIAATLRSASRIRD